MTHRFIFALLASVLWACSLGLHAQTAPARPEFIYVLRVLPAFHTPHAWTDKENAAIGKHFERLKMATAQGQVILAGKTTEALDATFGLVIFEADNEAAARQFMQSDPAVVAGLMSATLHPYVMALARKP